MRLLLIVCLAWLPLCARAADLVRVGDGPFISGGAFYVARDKGYFARQGIEIQTRQFDDAAMSVPSMLAGELDISAMTASAGLFNAIAKGAPLVMILDRGNNREGRAYTVVNVSNALYEKGVHGLADFAKLKGLRVGVGALGSINQFNVARALIAVGLDPANDVQWVANVAQPDLMKMLGQNQVDVTDLAYQFGKFAQDSKFGPMIATGDQIVPDAELVTFGTSRAYLAGHRDLLVRWAVAYLQGAREFNAAALDPDAHGDVVEILAKNTALNKPALVRAIAPHWSYVNEDGMPNADSVMAMQDLWAGDAFRMVAKKVPRAQMFDFTIAEEAARKLAAAGQ